MPKHSWAEETRRRLGDLTARRTVSLPWAEARQLIAGE